MCVIKYIIWFKKLSHKIFFYWSGYLTIVQGTYKKVIYGKKIYLIKEMSSDFNNKNSPKKNF